MNPYSYFNLKSPMLKDCSPAWYAAALEYLKMTGDTNGFCTMLRGS